MKNFKKLFSIVAIAAILGMAVPTTVLGAASYSDELQGAYDYAYGNGITTQSSIDTANMYGSLTRVAMAKMMANYAIEVLGQTPDTTKECSFPDVSAALDDQYDNGVTNACQLGLMGVGITNFNPNGLVTRAEFGTVLSRALYGDVNNGGTPYYVNHLQALKDAGIMNNIDTPSQLEVRGYVMLMMQRASGAETPAICETPENILSCSLGLDTCPTECQTVVAKEGTLTMSSVGVSYASIPMAGLVNFGSIKLDAASADITVNSIKIKMQGLASLTGAYRVFFEKDGVRISGRASFSDNIATVTFTSPLLVKTTETIDVVMELNEITAGDEIQLVSTDINSTAQTVNGSFASASLRTADYTVMAITGTAPAVTYSDYKVDETKFVEMGELKVATNVALNRAVIVKSLTVNNSGSQSNLSYLSDLGLYRDDVKVSTKTTVWARTVTFVLADEIKNTQSSANYVIKGKIINADDVNETYNFYLRNNTDLLVIEKDTSFRTSIVNNTPQTMGLVRVAGGDLRFNETTTSNLTVIPGTKNVVFYEGTITSLDAIELDTLHITGTTNPTTSLNTILQNLYVKIGTTVIAVDEITSANSYNFLFDGQATVQGTVPFMIYGDIKTDAPAASILFQTTPINKAAFATARYVADDSNVASSIGSIAGKKVTVTAADFALSNSSATSKNVQRGDKNVEIGKLEFSTTSDVVSKLYSFQVATTALATGRQNFDGGQVTVYDANGTALVSNTITSGANRTPTFTLPTALTVAKWAPVVLTVKVDTIANSVSTGGMYFQLTFTGVKAKDMINYNYVGTWVSATSTLLQSVIGGTPSIVSQTYTNSLVKYGTQVVLGNVKIKTTNADIVFKDAYFTLSGLVVASGHMNKISSAKLFEDGIEIATLTKNGNVLYATNLNKTIVLGTTKTYEVRGTLTTINAAADFVPTFTTYLGTGTFEGTYGAAISTVLTGKISDNITPINEIPTITAVDGYTKGNDVVYKITLNSTKQVDLSGLKLSVNGTNLSGTTNGITGYLAAADINYATTNYTTSVVGTNTLTFAGLAQGAVSIQGTTTLYVILPGAALLVGSNGNASTVRVAATDMDYMDIFTDDNSAHLNTSVLYNYQTAIAGTLDLLKVVSIQ